MEKSETLTLRVSSSFKDLWRYNISVGCFCYDNLGKNTGFYTKEDTVFDVGVSQKPQEKLSRREVTLDIENCAAVTILVYVIPNTLPRENSIEKTDDFNLKIEVFDGDNIKHSSQHRINQWGGANIRIEDTF